MLVGILLLSNVDKGVDRYEHDRVRVFFPPALQPKDVLSKLPPEVHADPASGDESIVIVPDGKVDEYVKSLPKTTPGIYLVMPVEKEPEYSFALYFKALKKQVNNYLDGQLGTLQYKTNLDREYDIQPQLKNIVTRSLSYLVPGLVVSVLLGVLLAVWAGLQPRVGQWLDAANSLLLGLPDFFVVCLLQLFAIKLAQAAGHNVVLIMQFGENIPFLIPFLAIAILPCALIYGQLRIAMQREWAEGYIKTASSKGLSRRQILFRHILRNTWEDFLAIFPRAVSIGVTSLVIAEVMTGIFGLGGYAVNPRIEIVTSLPTTCAILALFVMAAHLLAALLRKKFVVGTKEVG